ncbi:MAG: type II secretion system F family protein [Candidatus Omnitrophica bacterium]|nr:type II secretion system F family protein [Candidatus Omnitrophota bacterium]HOX55037.1 type II secretion system F family protein [Candidatus Omnitrophota bacterium]
MATFKYTAKDQAARSVSGKIVAKDKETVVEELRKRKLVVISVTETKGAAAMEFKFGVAKKVKTDDLVIFSRQLATMVDAGIPLMQSLDVLKDQIKHGEFKRVIGSLHDDIEVGNSLSNSFAKYPNVFDALYINMVKAGESSGMLNIILERLAAYLEKMSGLKRKIKTAMVYPIMVVSMAIIITAILMLKVVPTFKGIFDMLGGELPLPTRILILVSDLFSKWVLYLIGAIIVIGFLVGRWARTEKGSYKIDQLKLNLPVFGELFRKVAISRFSRTLSTLIQSGVPILAALEIVGKTSGNKVVENAIENVRTNVKEGESIATPLIKSGVFPPMVTRMISVGEQTGELEKMLGKVSDFYDEQVDAAISGLTSLIEPVIIAFLGVIVGGIVISLFLPILKITQLIGR